jgi:RHS repeat-associated protein
VIAIIAARRRRAEECAPACRARTRILIVKLRCFAAISFAALLTFAAARAAAQQCTAVTVDQSTAAIGADWSVQPTPCMDDTTPPQIMPAAPSPLVVTPQKLRGTGAAPVAGAARAGGDPVLGDGEFYEQRSDVELGGFGLRYAFTRTYRSRVTFLGGLGYSWDHNYDRRLLGKLVSDTMHAYGDSDAFLVPNGGIDYSDGALNLIHFSYSYKDNASNVVYYSAPPGVAMALEQHLADHTFLLRDATGVVNQFDSRGLLAAISDLAGNTMSFSWTKISQDVGSMYRDTAYRGQPYHLDTVIDSAKRAIHYVYDTHGYMQCVTLGADCSSGALVSFAIDPTIGVLKEIYRGPTRVERYVYDYVATTPYPYALSDCVANPVIPELCERFCNKPDRNDWANTCLDLDLGFVVTDFCDHVDCQWRNDVLPPQLQCKRANHATPDPLCMAYNNLIPDCMNGCLQRWQCEATFDQGKGPERFSFYSFGTLADLKYNLTDIYDEKDQLVVHNTYGGNAADVSFDRVISQQIGPSGGNPNVITFEYHDLNLEAAGALIYTRPSTRNWPGPYSTPDPSYVQPLYVPVDGYQPLQACPATCATTDPNTGACLYRTYGAPVTPPPLLALPYTPRAAVVIRDLHNTRTRYYNASFDLIREVVAASGGTSEESTYYDYENGFTSGTLDASGMRNCIAHDALGRPLQVTTLPATQYAGDQTPEVTLMTYDAFGQIARVAQDAAGGVAEIHYHRDPHHRIDGIDRDVTPGQPAQHTTLSYEDDPAPVGVRETPATVSFVDGSSIRYASLDPSGGGPQDTYVDAGSPSPQHFHAQYDLYGRLRVSQEVGGYGEAWDYDDSFRLSSVSHKIDPTSTTWVAEPTSYHNSDGALLDSLTEPSRVTTYQYHGRHPYLVTRTPATTGAGETPQKTCYDYAADGWLQSVVLPEGNELHYSRDALGRLRTVMKGYPQQPQLTWWNAACAGHARPDGDPGFVVNKAYEYLAGGFLSRLVEDNVVRDVTTDGFGRIIQLEPPTKYPATNPAGPVQFGYDSRGRVIWRAELANNPSGYPAVPYAKPTMTRPGLVSMVEYQYDFLNRVTSESHWAIERHEVLTTTTSYDDIKRTVTVTDRGVASVLTFDPRGRLVSRRDPDQSTMRVDHYVGYDVVTQQTNQGTSLVRTTSYDSRGNLVGVVDENQQTLYTARYDDDGNRWYEKSIGAGAQTRYFDAFARKYRETTELGNGQVVDQHFGWDNDDRLVRFDDGLHQSWTTQYTGFDQPLSITDPAQRADRFIYAGGFSQPAGRVDAVGRHRCYRYDEEMHLQYLYDADCPATSDIRGPAPPLVDRKQLVHGSRGEIMEVVTAADAVHGNAQSVVRYAYDSIGRSVLHEVEAYGAGTANYRITHDYPDLGRTDVTQAQQLTNGEDNECCTTGICRPCPTPPAWAVTFRHSFDSEDRLASIDLNGSRVATWSFGVGSGGPTSLAYGNGTSTTFTYDARLRPRLASVAGPATGGVATAARTRAVASSSKLSPGPGPGQCPPGFWCPPPPDTPPILATVEDAYGADSVLRMRQRTFGGLSLTDVYQVDGGGRVAGESLQLTGIALPAGEVSEDIVSSHMSTGPDWRLYGVDVNGDWRSVAAATTGGQSVDHTVDSLGRLTAIGSQSMNRDTRDNLTGLAGDAVSFVFDDATALLLTAKNGSLVHNYVYDAADRRALDVSSDGRVSAYVWDGDHLIAHGDPSNLTIDVPGGDLDEHVASVGQNGSGTPLYYHRGSDFSTLAITDSSGQLVEAYSYSAFGEPTAWSPTGGKRAQSAVATPFLFQGQIYDSSTATYYMRARQYAAKWGRFLSPDPLGAAPAPSRYAFTGSRPLNHRDPLGLFDIGGFTSGVNPIERAAEDHDPSALSDIAKEVEEAVTSAVGNIQTPPIPNGETLDPEGAPITDHTSCGTAGCVTYQTHVYGRDLRGLSPQYLDSLDVFRTPTERLDRQLNKLARAIGVRGAKLTTNGDFRDVLDRFGRKVIRATTGRGNVESDWFQPQELLLGGLLGGIEAPVGSAAAKEAADGAPKLLLPGLKLADSQFGKKAAQHARDFGLNAASAADREILRDKITGIVQLYEEVKQGAWRGGAMNNLFFRSGADVVVTTANGDYVTILSGGVTNGWFQSARVLAQ